jgi:O-antigen/teichoic acid export membrane protein
VRDAARLATRYSTLILVPLAFGLFSTAKASLALFVGESYVAGYLSLMIFCGAFAFSAFAMALNPLLLALEKTRTAAWVTCLTVITGLGVAYTILPKYGILGAAVARALTIILSSILIALVVRKSVGSSLDLSAVAKTLIAGTTMATVVGVVQLLTYNKFMLPIYFLIGATVYLTMLRLLNAVEIADMDLLRRLLGNRLSLVSGFISWLLLSRDSRVKYRSQ